MSVFKTTFSRALRVIPTDNAVVPSPQPIITGTNTSAITNQLVDASVDFVNLNVSVGDVIYNITDGTAATVISVLSSTVVVINSNIFTSTGKTYVIYQQSAQTSYGNSGCFLFVGGAGNVAVTTIGGDDVVFNAVPVGTILPVQVLKVKSSGSGTTATLINALW